MRRTGRLRRGLDTVRRRGTVMMLGLGIIAFGRGLGWAGEPVSPTQDLAQHSPPGPLQSQPSLPAPPARTREQAEWSEWSTTVKDGLRFAINRWRAEARFADVQVMAASAIGGRVEGPELVSLALAAPSVVLLTGQSRAVVLAMVGTLSDAWKTWQQSLRVPRLPWYPAFAAFPGSMAPPMPNIPTPVASLTQDLHAFEPPALAQSMRSRLGEAASLSGADDAIAEVIAWFNAGFASFAGSNVMQVMGKGPVPTFAPPSMPVGPVVGGDIISTPGHFRGTTAAW